MILTGFAFTLMPLQHLPDKRRRIAPSIDVRKHQPRPRRKLERLNLMIPPLIFLPKHTSQTQTLLIPHPLPSLSHKRPKHARVKPPVPLAPKYRSRDVKPAAHFPLCEAVGSLGR